MTSTLEEGGREEGDLEAGEQTCLKGAHQKIDMKSRYIEKMSRFVQSPKSLKLVIDAGNGSVGPEISQLLAKFPL